MKTNLANLARSILVVLAVGSHAGCKEQNSNYCDKPTTTHNCKDQDAANSCGSDGDCSGATPACDVTGSKTCVQCVAPNDTSACTGATPTCGSDNICRKCEAHSECASHACLADGSCASESMVAYVDPAGTDNTTCTKAMPCTSVAKALATSRPYVKLTGTTDEAVTVNNQDVTLLADQGAKLTRTSNGIILQVTGTSQLDVYDLEISGASGANNPGISMPAGNSARLRLYRTKLSANQGGGIIVAAGNIEIAQSVISANPGGGISVSGVGTMFDIENNFIVYNGVATGPSATQLGGAAILSNTSGAKFTFNTVAYNGNDGSIYRGGVSCTGSMVTAAGNIAYKNTEGTSTSNTTQSGGNCQFGNSLALGSVAGDLGFKSPTMNPFDFHLTAASPATVVDAGGACTGIDIDGDTRPFGAACDLGADEYKP